MLSIRSVSKTYAAHTALSDISLEIPKGSIFGLLGPNGAGKTSLIRIINQITAPDQGEIYFDGHPLKPEDTRRIGYLPEERGLYKKMEVGEQILYLAQLKGISRPEAIERARKWVSKLDMKEWWDKKVEDLSKGMQQKIQFIVTVIHDPELLILDEPFTGFDPINAEIIRQEIMALNRNGTTIIFSTHRLENIEEFCTHLALIDHSKKILDGKTEDILKGYRTQTYQLDYTGRMEAFTTLLPTHFTLLHDQAMKEYRQATVRIDQGGVNDLLTALLPNITVAGLKEKIPTIHEIFIQKVTEHSFLSPV